MVKILEGDGKAIFSFFIGTIIAIVFLASIADSVFDQTNTFTITNHTVTVGAINDSVTSTGRDLIGTGTVSNSSFSDVTGEIFWNGLIISDAIVSGVKTVRLVANDTASDRVGNSVNLTYDYNPDGYLTQSVDRSIAVLIVLFGALATLVFGVVVLIKNGSLGRLMGKDLSIRRRK